MGSQLKIGMSFFASRVEGVVFVVNIFRAIAGSFTPTMITRHRRCAACSVSLATLSLIGT